MLNSIFKITLAIILASLLSSFSIVEKGQETKMNDLQTKKVIANKQVVKHKTIDVNGVSIFYREAGDPNAETILMLHGFPSSSHMYRHIAAELADDYHVIAPDYPGFGLSDTPSITDFEYTFANVTNVMEEFLNKLSIDSYYILMQDYGGPIGFRLAQKSPEKIKGFIVQNANAYFEGLGEWAQKLGAMKEANDLEGINTLKDWFMSLEGLKAMYVVGAKDPSKVDPVSYLTDEAFLRREGNNEIQTTLFNDYGSNFPKYEEWQKYLRDHQPPTIVIWGIHDKFFSKEGAEAFAKDLKDVEIHLLDGAHFVLEEYHQEAADLITKFINKN